MNFKEIQVQSSFPNFIYMARKMLNIYDLNKKMCKYVTHLQSTFFVLKENDDFKSRVTLVYYRKMIALVSNDANEIIYICFS